MSSLAYTAADSATMLRRQLRHIRRYPSMTLILVGMPVVFLLLFVYVFGGTLGNGLGVSGGRDAYVEYVTPGILLMTIAAAAQGTAISVSMDMTQGIIARFRTMSISRGSVLTGHVLGSMAQMSIGLAVVLGVALLVGFRPHADLIQWIEAAGLMALIGLAMIWLSVALGLVSESVETASNLPMFLIILPFISSGFVPTDSMPSALRLFADYQPFTPIIEALRSLLAGRDAGIDGPVAVAWCAAITLVGYLWARKLYERNLAGC